MSIQTGDTVTIRRGKLAGASGEVIAINHSEAVLKLAGGTFSTQNVTNIKAPDVPSINADDLADIFNGNVSEWSSSLAEQIDAKLPGFGARLT